MKLSIIIPVYNEKNTVEQLLARVMDVKIAGWEKQVVVVDDGSTDGTVARLKKWENRCTVVYQKRNQGKGAALREGFSKLNGDIILIQDADLEYTPDDYLTLLKPLPIPASRWCTAPVSSVHICLLCTSMP